MRRIDATTLRTKRPLPPELPRSVVVPMDSNVPEIALRQKNDGTP